MQNYEKAVDALMKVKGDVPAKENQLQVIHTASIEILDNLKMNHKAICQSAADGARTRKLLAKLVISQSSELTALLREILEILYLKESQLLQLAVYPNYPVLLRRLIEAQQGKGTELDLLLRIVYANEAGRHNRFLRERDELHNSPFVRDLYSIHFGKPRSDPQGQQAFEKSLELEQSQSAGADKRAMKSLLLCLVYRQLEQLDQSALLEYLRTIYIYCGGDGTSLGSVSSFYLLQKRNLFNLFRYSISQQQIEWMLLTLYELATQSNALKYELLAAINMIYKKTANESMFRYSQIAQSIIHLLEDQYQDVFN